MTMPCSSPEAEVLTILRPAGGTPWPGCGCAGRPAAPAARIPTAATPYRPLSARRAKGLVNTVQMPMAQSAAAAGSAGYAYRPGPANSKPAVAGSNSATAIRTTNGSAGLRIRTTAATTIKATRKPSTANGAPSDSAPNGSPLQYVTLNTAMSNGMNGAVKGIGTASESRPARVPGESTP